MSDSEDEYNTDDDKKNSAAEKELSGTKRPAGPLSSKTKPSKKNKKEVCIVMDSSPRIQVLADKIS